MKKLIFCSVVLFLFLFLYSCQEEEEVQSSAEVKAVVGTAKILQDLKAGKNIEFPKEMEVGDIGLSFQKNCNCRFDFISATEELAELPGSAYWLASIYYTDVGGNYSGPWPIGVTGFFPDNRTFIAQSSTSFDVEFAYLPGPTFPGGEVRVRVSCEKAPPVYYIFEVEEGSGTYQENQSGNITSNCGTTRSVSG